MKRLTLREVTGCVLPGFENNGVNGCYDIPDAEWLEESIDRLAAIEDILGDEYDLDRLRELAEADREGRCVVLPRLEPGQGDPPGEPGSPGPPGLCPNCNDYRGIVWDEVTGSPRCTICGWTNAKT